MWFFGSKDKGPKKGAPAKAGVGAPAPASASKKAKQDALLAQMRTLRAEIGEENLQKMVQKMKLDDLKKQVRHDIENDPIKRDRLLDELRMHLHDRD